MSDIKSRSGIGSDIKLTVVLRLTPDLLLAVDEAAERRKISRNAFMVKALTRVVAGEPQVHSVTPRPKRAS